MIGLMLGLGIIGAGFAIFSGLSRAAEEQEEIAARQEEERRMREAQVAEQRAKAERDIAYAKSVFKIEQEDAFRKADDIWHQGERIDMRADIDESLTGRAFNLAMKQNAAADESLLHQEQRKKQNFQNQQGNLKMALGMSGARAGANSAEQLLEQNKTNFNQDLGLMQRQRETQKEMSFMQAFSNLKSGMFRIDEERDAANKAFRDSKQLRDDYTGTFDDTDIDGAIDKIKKEYAAKIEERTIKNMTDFALNPLMGLNGEEEIALLEKERESKIAELKKNYTQRASAGNGRAVNLFNQNIANRRLDLSGSIDLQNLAGYFKQATMQRAHDRAAYSFSDGLTDAFTGFNTGFNFANNVGSFFSKWAGGATPNGILMSRAERTRNPWGGVFG